MMQLPGPNADCPQPLPLFRPEALAARQNLHGRVLRIRSFSFGFLAWLAASVCVLFSAYVALARYVPTIKISGVVSDVETPDHGSMQVIFSVPVKWTRSIQPGSQLVLHCSRCSRPVSFRGIVAGFGPSLETTARETSTKLATPEPVCKVTVTLLKQNSPMKGPDRLQPGTTLEAEFPLEPRPLFQWLMGTTAT